MNSRLLRLPRCIPQLLLATFAAVSHAQQGELEQLLTNRQNPQFQREADAALSLPDAAGAEAAFLLGKAYHLGLGRDVDIDQAITYYERAARSGHARAIHNLGMVHLDAGDRSRAIRLLEDALARGLTMPTLLNLGRAHDVTRRRMFGAPAERDSLLLAAGYYEQAYALEPGDGLVSDIVRVRVAALRIVPNAQDHKALMRWVDLGVQKDIATVYQNYGALLFYGGDLEGSRPWFEKAHARGVPAAAHALGLMAKKSAPYADQTLDYFVAAATGGFQESMYEITQLLERRLSRATSQQELAAEVAKTESLTPLAKKMEAPDWPPGAYEKALQRLEQMRTVAKNLARPPTVPGGQPINMNLCFADVPGPSGLPLAGQTVRVIVTDDSQMDTYGILVAATSRTRVVACGCPPARCRGTGNS
jgi:TPR repeat protein